MADMPVNKKITSKIVRKPNLDVTEASLFSKQVDTNLWESVSAQLKKPKSGDEPTLQSQIIKFKEEAQKQKMFMPNSSEGSKINFNC